MLRYLKGLLCGVAFFSSFAFATAPQPIAQYPEHAGATETTVTVHIIWMPSIEAVNAFCGLWEPGHPGTIVGCYNSLTHTIYAVQPENFNDHFLLEVLGHEFWHSLGAEHPAL